MDASLEQRFAASFGKLRRPSPDELADAWEQLALTLDEVLPLAGEPGVYPYGRKKIFSTPEIEVLVMNWAARRECAPHDHGASFGWVHVMAGTVTHTLFTLDRDGIPVPFGSRLEHAGSRYFAPRSLVHSMGNPQDDLTVTVHVYCPPITGMKVCDLSRCAACVVSDDCGAWWPDDQRQLVREIKLARSDALPRTGPVSLAELLDRTVDDAGVRDRLETNGADVASLAQLDVPVSRPRALTPISLDQDTPQLLLRAGHASSTLVVIAGRVEVVPLDRPTDAVLVGEGQSMPVAQGQRVGVRLSQSSSAAKLLDVSYGEEPMERLAASSGDELAAIPRLRDYYYGYADRYATVYAAGGAGWEPEAPNEALVHAIDDLQIKSGAVIDLGCGEGRDSIYLAARGFTVTGVDVARVALERARARAADRGVPVTFLERDVIDLRGIPAASFDLAINMGCLHMIPDRDLRERHLRRVREILRPGGVFVIAHCAERWGDGFYSIPDYDAVAPLVPGKVVERRVRIEDGGTAMLPLPVVPYHEASKEDLLKEVYAAGFEPYRDLKVRTDAFGSTALVAARRPE